MAIIADDSALALAMFGHNGSDIKTRTSKFAVPNILQSDPGLTRSYLLDWSVTSGHRTIATGILPATFYLR